ncbi:MAG: MFS transporter [Pirellulales bacterium]
MIRSVAKQYRRAFSGLPIQVWYLAIVVLVNRAGSMVLPFLALYVTEGLSLGESAAGWMLAIYGVGSCAGAFVGGMVADRLGPFRIQVFSLILSGFGYFAMTLATGFWSLAIIVVLTSFSADAFRPANGASVTLLAPPELHKRAFSLNRLAINLGYTVGPTVGGILATISYEFLFWIDGLTSWFAAATFLIFLGLKSPTVTVSNSEETESCINTVEEIAPWKNTPFLVFLFLTFITFCVFFQLISTFPIFLKAEYQLSKVEIGSLFGVNTLGVVAFEMVLIQMLERKNLIRLIAWGSLFMCLGFGLLPYGVGYWFAMATVSVWTLGEMLAMPQMLAYVAQASTSRNRSAYMGYYTTCVALSMMVGPLIGTHLYEWNHTLCWHFASVVGVLACVGFYMLDRSIAVSAEETALASG